MPIAKKFFLRYNFYCSKVVSNILPQPRKKSYLTFWLSTLWINQVISFITYSKHCAALLKMFLEPFHAAPSRNYNIPTVLKLKPSVDSVFFAFWYKIPLDAKNRHLALKDLKLIYCEQQPIGRSPCADRLCSKTLHISLKPIPKIWHHIYVVAFTYHKNWILFVKIFGKTQRKKLIAPL